MVARSPLVRDGPPPAVALAATGARHVPIESNPKWDPFLGWPWATTW